MYLSELKQGDKGIITKVKGRGAFRKRITEMGFVKGQEVTVVKGAPLKDPIEYNIMGYEVSLRKSEAALVEIITLEEAKNQIFSDFQGVITNDLLKTSAKEKGKTINVALVGNPNCGKTTLFNYASGSKEHVGNYSGVTVDAKEAKFKQGDYTFKIVDLPGTYSLSAYTPEELYVRRFISNEIPDIVINVLDASNLERNLFLTTQLIDMDIKVVIALNMYDELTKRGDSFNHSALGEMIGIPIVPTVSSKGKGLEELFSKIIDVYEDNDPIVRHIHINYNTEVEASLRKVQDEIWKNKSITDKISSRFISLKLLEKDDDIQTLLSNHDNINKINSVTKKEITRLEKILNEDSETIIADSKYGFISGALKETFKGAKVNKNTISKSIDNVLTHKLLGLPLFILFMFITFLATFSLGKYPMNWIDEGIGLLSSLLTTYMPDGTLKDLLIDGVIGGVGGVVIYLPNILILFFFISFMEDTGYMARAAFIMDKLMHKIGLHGKSFIPMIMGFGCTVPAIMATRTLEDKNDRLLTMLITPFMSCSARLPVYILIIGAFFPNNATLMLFAVYGIGIFFSIIIAKVFNKTIFKTKDVPFVMELPPYRIPTVKSTMRHMWSKGAQYLKKMGGVILVASVIIWALGYYPKEVNFSKDYDTLILSASGNKELQEKITNEKLSEAQEKSYIGRIGHFIEPVIRPLGFDWKMGVSLLTGIAGKEIVVSTMGVLYQADYTETSSLTGKLQNETYLKGENKGKKVYNPLVAFGFLMFILIYFPCIAVIVAIKHETGSWKWPIFTIAYTTLTAWVISFLIYQIGNILI